MLGDREILSRQSEAKRQGTPFTNYGMVIAKTNGILERATEILHTV